MKKILVLNDWLFNIEILKDNFNFLKNEFEITYANNITDEHKNTFWDIVIAWGSSSLLLLEQFDKIKHNVTVLISPYLDFDYFFSWCYENNDWKNQCFKKSKVNNIKYFNENADFNHFKNKKISFKEPIEKKNIYIFVSGNDELLNLEDLLKIEFFFKNSSIHLIEETGFAPFEENQDMFQKIFKGFVIDENF